MLSQCKYTYLLEEKKERKYKYISVEFFRGSSYWKRRKSPGLYCSSKNIPDNFAKESIMTSVRCQWSYFIDNEDLLAVPTALHVDYDPTDAYTILDFD